jgi:pimeloyl-ACP methyl ester carboxylesterase
MSSTEREQRGAPDADVLILGDGRRVGVAVFGAREGFPIIALHGMPGSRLMYATVTQAAARRGIRLIAVDRPGYGRSDRCARGTLLDYAGDVAGIAEIMGLERFAVLGASGGGSYALACAAHLGSRLTRVGVVSGIGPLRTPRSLSSMASVNRWVFRLARVSPALVGVLLPRLVRRSLPQLQAHVAAGTSPNPSISPAVLRLVVEDQAEAIRQGGAGIAFDAANLWRPWRFPLIQIKVPTHLWHGDADNLAPVALGRLMAEAIPSCEATIYPGEGHAEPLIRHADEIMAAMAG